MNELGKQPKNVHNFCDIHWMAPLCQNNFDPALHFLYNSKNDLKFLYVQNVSAIFPSLDI